jgi:SWI/SNF-related matrix-associated actin-dependent regulator 1 of chromatin subfamily A
MQIVEHTNGYRVHIPYNRFRVANTNAIKGIPGASFNWAGKVWMVPVSQRTRLQELKAAEKSYNPIEWVPLSLNLPEQVGEIKPLPELEHHFPLKQGSLRDYQAKGVARGLELQRFINGDEQRLGKTLQTIVTLMIADQIKKQDVFPCLVIAPSTLKFNWQEEWDMWVGKKAMILEDKVKSTWHRFHELGMNDVFIVNPQSLKKFFVDYMPPKGKLKKSTDIVMNERIKLFKSVIIDESHRFKDPSTQQTKIALQIALGKEWIILLSGTPVKNKPVDLFSQLAIMGRLGHFEGAKGFKQRYCEGGNGASHLKELQYRLNQYCFFRRERKEVLDNLPPKQRQTILCDITTREQYNRAKNDFVKFLMDKGCSDAEIARKMRGEIMVKMQELKKISALGKLNEVKEYIQDIIDNNGKIVIFCVLHAIVDELKKAFPSALSITGRENDTQKQNAKNAFQACAKCGVNLEHHQGKDHEYVQNNNPLIICNIQAAGVGLNLSAADETGFVEFPWTAADSFQCEDRVFDVKKDNHIMATYFLGHNTIDEENFELIKSKAGLSNAITGSTDEMATELIDKVFNSLNFR